MRRDETHGGSAGREGQAAGRRRAGLVATMALAATALTATVAGVLTHADSAPANPSDPASPVTVAADALPTVQIDGVAWSQVVVGNTVYVGGRFTNARPAGAAPGTNQTPRSNFLAYDLTTGNLITSFAPSFNAQVRTLTVSPDGTRLYVGGDFTSISGTSRSRIAAFDLATGQLVPFFPSVAYHVHAIAVHPSGSPVYVGGNFNAVGSVARGQLAAFQASNGALLDWAPQATGGLVKAMAISPDGTKLAVGGQFTALNNSNNPGFGLGMVDAVTGASLPMAINSTVRNGGNLSGIVSLVADGNDFFGSGFWFGGAGTGNFEGAFSASFDGGAINWLADCHGDTHSVYPSNGVVYNVGHAHECGGLGAGGFQRTEPWSFYRGLAFSRAATGTLVRDPYGYFNYEGQPAPSLLNWFPALDAGTFTGQNQGPWHVTGNGQYVVMGGEFRNVNDAPQQGLVRFAVSTIAPNDQIPRQFLANWLPRVVSVNPGEARITWSGNWDRDNENFTYQVFRDNDGTRVYTGTGRSSFYEMDQFGFTDTGLTPGASVRYRVKAIDPFGNEAPSDWVTVTVAGGQASPYASTALEDRPLHYWRLGESSGAAVNSASYDNLTVNGSVTRNVAGALSGDTNTAMRFSGATTQYAAATTARLGRHTFSVEAWVRTDDGGKIIGFGNRSTGNSTSYDRHLYVGSDGRVRFGVSPASGTQVVTSPTAIDDNAWHHVVGTLGGGVMTLYVDGQQVGQLTNVPMAANYQGVWRVGGDNLSGWPNRPNGDYFDGTIDEAAVYPRALTAAEVAQNYAVGSTGTTPNQPPTASFTATATPLAVAVDATASVDADGTIVTYGWDFGDGTTVTAGATTAHTYAAAGTYTVTLTVTDDDGATAATTRQVVVPAPPPNQVPTAAFTAATSPLSVAVDGSASADADGTIVSYAWNFGDGATATGATATHPYALAGTYTVTLTVTDDDGAIGTLSQDLVVPDVPVNGEPTAVFTATPQPLQVSVDASASTDADGTIVAYAWDFGDGGTATGVTASHPYAAAGTYTVTLTVTDDVGATGTSSQSVVVPDLPVGPQPFATDAFERTVANGLGTADLGGTWTTAGSAANFSVSGGQARLRMNTAGSGVSAFLPGTSTDTEVRATVGADKAATGGGAYLSVVGRRVGTSDYRAKVRLLNTGGVQVFITRVSGGETDLGSLTVPGLTVAVGERLNVRFQATGTSPTTLRVKVWKVGTPEPADWQLTRTDTTPALQSGGGVGFVTYLSGSATNAPLVGIFDELWAGPTA